MARRAVYQGDEYTVLGVDSGSANVGICVVRGDPRAGVPGARLLHLEYFSTKPASKKMRRKIRVSTDDRRRLDEIVERVGNVVAGFSPDALAVEWYHPNPTKRSKDGWKAALTAAGLLVLAKERRIAAVEQLPQDVKNLVGMPRASKEDVRDWLRDHLRGFAEAIDQIADSYQSHPSDAAGHALQGIFELAERRREAGL